MYTVFLEDFTYPLEKEMATHSSILAWKTPWTEEPGRLQSWGHKELDTTSLFYFYFYKKRGNIDFLQTGKLSKVWKRLLTCRAFCVF